MSDQPTKQIASEQPPTGVSVWAGMIIAPASWALDLVVRYALVEWCCKHGGKGLLIGLSLAFFTGAALCAAACFAEWRAAGLRVPVGSEPGPLARARFMAALGLLSSSFFSVVIAAQAVAPFFVDPCLQ